MNGYLIIRGPAGIGKSTLANGLMNHFKRQNMLCSHKMPGMVRRRLKLGFSLKDKLKADNLLIKQVKRIIKRGTIVILDEVFYYPQQIQNFERKLGKPIAIIHLKASLKTCLNRNRRRQGNHRLSDKAIKEVHALDTQYAKGHKIRTDKLTPNKIILNAIKLIKTIPKKS